ncbi:hypothetical protein BDR04DRAFT_1164850 [Suillus decipiens]|nr:hypothetical protein BDR04DRAFT_1164850 [Suillus decipiens]
MPTHTDFACLLFSHLKRHMRPDTVERIINYGVVIVPGFLSCALPICLVDMNTELTRRPLASIVISILVCNKSL